MGSGPGAVGLGPIGNGTESCSSGIGARALWRALRSFIWCRNWECGPSVAEPGSIPLLVYVMLFEDIDLYLHNRSISVFFFSFTKVKESFLHSFVVSRTVIMITLCPGRGGSVAHPCTEQCLWMAKLTFQVWSFFLNVWKYSLTQLKKNIIIIGAFAWVMPRFSTTAFFSFFESPFSLSKLFGILMCRNVRLKF